MVPIELGKSYRRDYPMDKSGSPVDIPQHILAHADPLQSASLNLQEGGTAVKASNIRYKYIHAQSARMTAHTKKSNKGDPLKHRIFIPQKLAHVGLMKDYYPRRIEFTGIKC